MKARAASRLTLLAVTAALSACVYRFDALSGKPQPPAAVPRSIAFIAFGDAGTGSARQLAAGRAMARVCADRGCDLALELGDNFYPSGVRSANDPQFDSAFEKPYALFDMPVFAVLGNHDNSSTGGYGDNNANGNFQLQYRSPKWKMPARYYQFALPETAATPLADFFALDSNPLTAYRSDPDPQWAAPAYAAKQLDWLQQRMRASVAVWKIAFAHHPYITNGLHGDAGHYDADSADANHAATAHGALWKDTVERGLCANGADLYIAAHDHDLEWLKPDAACGKTQFIVSGSAAPEKARPLTATTTHPVYWHAGKTAGFFWIKLTPERMTVAAFTLDDDEALTADHHGHPLPAYEQSVQRLH